MNTIDLLDVWVVVPIGFRLNGPALACLWNAGIQADTKANHNIFPSWHVDIRYF